MLISKITVNISNGECDRPVFHFVINSPSLRLHHRYQMRWHRGWPVPSPSLVQESALHLLYDQIEEQMRQLRVQGRLELERDPEIDDRRLDDVAHTRTEAPVVQQIVEEEAVGALGLDQKRFVERQIASVALDERREPNDHFRFGACFRLVIQNGFLAVRYKRFVVVDVGDDVVHLLHRVAIINNNRRDQRFIRDVVSFCYEW